jgi:hypothetical protein
MSNFEGLVARHQRRLGTAQAAAQRPGPGVRGRPARAPSSSEHDHLRRDPLRHRAADGRCAPSRHRALARADLRPLFADRTLAIGEDVVLQWRQMLEAGRRRGHIFSQRDVFVAAVAALEDLVVVSRDTREFVAAEGASDSFRTNAVSVAAPRFRPRAARRPRTAARCGTACSLWLTTRPRSPESWI